MKHLALYRDTGPSADGRSHALGVFDERSDARSAIAMDVARYCGQLNGLPLTVEENETGVSVKTGLDEYLCEWEIVSIT